MTDCAPTPKHAMPVMLDFKNWREWEPHAFSIVVNGLRHASGPTTACVMSSMNRWTTIGIDKYTKKLAAAALIRRAKEKRKRYTNPNRQAQPEQYTHTDT